MPSAPRERSTEEVAEAGQEEEEEEEEDVVFLYPGQSPESSCNSGVVAEEDDGPSLDETYLRATPGHYIITR